MEQLAFFPEISKEEYKRIQKEVAKVLFSYRVLKVRMQNQEECSIENINSPFVEIRNTKKPNDIKYIQTKRALEHALDAEQREIIERKYLKNGLMSDKAVKAQMMLENNWFYTQKRNAIMAIATALRII
ncbi:ArpU family phage packaging/lysis transcriptional regulator [Bacillus paranthracis]|uniref:ArpU family phage packaging/lysis transcriptional regulator n=1 Tax=Bacillus paranthracis TaxID=2026186 RepID=UPI0013D3BBB9|nr:ArpU family phage packaging/lysis transcriptional regulator [Bacillus paranthracis]